MTTANPHAGSISKSIPSVFVAVPCYNYGRFLEQCVGSVLAQAGVEVQVLIIDDASSDDTADVARRLTQNDPRVHFIRHVNNAGHIATFNEGIAAASGDYFLLLSADDYLLPGALGRAAALMERRRDVAFTFGQATVEGQETGRVSALPVETMGQAERILTGREFVELSGPRNIVPALTAVIRRSVQQRAGGYLNTLPHSGDMEMWLRLAAAGAVGYIAAVQAVYRRHDNNMSIAYDGLPDLIAREKAFRAFFADGALKLDPSRRLERDCLHRLAGEAFRHAGMALNRGDSWAAARFRKYGLSVSPTARLSVNWLKLLLKQMVRWQSLPSGN
jgi:GT2 family glycosyltransferase